MNCQRFQENLYDYLDDTLSPDEKAAAHLHLQTCGACRQALENERLIAQTLSHRLGASVETVTLNASARRTIANAMRKQLQNAGEPKKNFSLPPWMRLAIPSTAAGLLLISAIWLGHVFISQRDSQKNLFPSTGSAGLEVPVHVSFSAPQYTFHRDGAMVVDALTTETRVADGALLAKK